MDEELAAGSNPESASIKKKHVQQVESGDPAPLLCAHETAPGVPHSDVESSV